MDFNVLLKAIKNASILGVYIYQDEGRIVFANKAFLSFLGYEEKELIGKKLPELLRGSEKEIALKNIKRRLNKEEFPFEYTTISYVTKYGNLKPSLNFSYTIEYNNKPAGMVILIDIQKQKTFEVLFRSLSEINQLIVRCENERELLDSICDILVDEIGFKLAVVGSVTKKDKKFEIKSIKGRNGIADYFKKVSHYIDEALKNGTGTIGRAYKTGEIVYSENVFDDSKMKAWTNEFRKNNIYSACSIPIFKNDNLEYILIIYSDTPYRFSKEYVHILKELQLDVSFALKKMEEERDLKLFDKAVNSTSNWVVITDKNGKIIKANSAVEDISGYSLDEIIGKKPNIFKSGYHDNKFYKELWSKIREGKQERYSFVNKAKDGSLFYLDSIIIPVMINGELYRIIDISRDITTETLQKSRIEQLSSMYKTLSSVNEMLLESSNYKEIVKNLPKIILKNLNCEVAFVVEKDKKNKFSIASSAATQKRYENYFKEDVFKNERSIKKTPFFLSMKDGVVYVENNIRSSQKLAPFYSQSELYGFNSCFSLPIIKQKESVGALVGLLEKPDVFDTQMQTLLEKLKDNIHYALNKLETQKWFNIMSYAVNSGFDFVVITDSNFKIVYVNEKTEEISGYSKEEMVGKHHSIFSSKLYNKKFILDFYKTLSSGRVFSGVMAYKTKSSKIIRAIMNIMPFRVNGKVEYYIGVGKDITNEVHLQETVEDVLNHDHVTGLLNRRAFLKGVERFLERARYEKDLAALAVINPIDFSSINKAFGFEIGNEVLKKIAERITSQLREYDVVAKLESDKFAVFLKDIKHEENVIWILTKLMDTLIKPYNIAKRKVSLSFNMGISLYPKDDVDSSGLIEKAMLALVDAKAKGEGSLGFYKVEFEREAMRKLELRNSVKDALANNEFILYYQPYFSSTDKTLVGAEALIRWKKDGKIIPPLEFIPFLEETKMITSIEKWVMEEVLNRINMWKKKGLRVVPISINISPSSFGSFDFARDVISVIRKYNVEEHMINIEIIERLFLHNINYAKKVIRTLKKYGLSFSIDDFGTGYSSLSYLGKLSIDYVKIDISFVREMLRNNNTRAIVETIVYLTKRLKIKTIAEGVEEEEQLEFLRKIECDFIQGYLFSRPLPVEEFEKVLKAHTTFDLKK